MQDKSQKFFLNIEDTNNANFGVVERSAATFYCSVSAKKRTIVSVFDYWKIKNNLEVKVVASLRDMGGNLLREEELGFENGHVINYEPISNSDFEGSVEIEIFSKENLRFPYPAISVTYKTENSITLTHTYGRAYSRVEIEGQRVVPVGHESCWMIKDTAETRSFCVFHNGSEEIKEQSALLTLKKHNGTGERSVQFKLNALRPFETVKIYPRDYFIDLVTFLAGDVGHISIDFQLYGAFPRMLIGSESMDESKLQVTHSNFNYNKIQTDIVGKGDPNAIFMPPKIDCEIYNVIIYPDFTPGNYQVEIDDSNTRIFSTGEIVKIPVKGGEVLRFNREEVGFPSRLVVGVEYGKNKDSFVSECSLNIYTDKKLPKRFHWGNCLVNQQCVSKLLFTDLYDIFGGIGTGEEIILRFYAKNRKDYIERKFSGKDYPDLEHNGFNINNDAMIYEFMAGEIGWWTIFSNYKGLYPYIFVLDEKKSSAVLEHAF